MATVRHFVRRRKDTRPPISVESRLVGRARNRGKGKGTRASKRPPAAENEDPNPIASDHARFVYLRALKLPRLHIVGTEVCTGVAIDMEGAPHLKFNQEGTSRLVREEKLELWRELARICLFLASKRCYITLPSMARAPCSSSSSSSFAKAGALHKCT